MATHALLPGKKMFSALSIILTEAQNLIMGFYESMYIAPLLWLYANEMAYTSAMYYLLLKMVMSFLEFEIFCESLFKFLLQKMHFDTSQTVLEKRIGQNIAKR